MPELDGEKAVRPASSRALPSWPEGSVAVLVVAGLHAIPVSTALRAGERRIVFALAHRRETLTRLREEPRCTLCLLAAGCGFSAEGTARVVRDRLRASEHVAALELRVERVQDHLADGRTEIASGVAWSWTDDGAARADEQVRAELRELAGS